MLAEPREELRSSIRTRHAGAESGRDPRVDERPKGVQEILITHESCPGVTASPDSASPELEPMRIPTGTETSADRSGCAHRLPFRVHHRSDGRKPSVIQPLILEVAGGELAIVAQADAMVGTREHRDREVDTALELTATQMA